MRLQLIFNRFLAICVAIIVLVIACIYTVGQRQNAIIFQFGEIIDVKTEPGLYFLVPFLHTYKLFDVRILTVDTTEPERFITSEKKNVLVDLYVKWKIIDPKQFFVSVGGDEMRAQTRLMQTVNDSLRAEFGKRTIHEVISGEREKIMEILRAKANLDAKKIGVQVLDVRLKRVDLPQEVSESVYRRMEAERKRVANELRSQGSAEAEKIRADAEKQRDILIAEAYRQAQQIKGEGDGKAAAIYAQAYTQNPEFYSFYRSLEAYKQTFKGKNDVLVVDPSSDFFKYMKNRGAVATPR